MYTLEQLALFDRCLFPGDFQTQLMNVGMSGFQAAVISGFIESNRRKGNMVGIIQVYQEFIDSEEITKAIDAVVSEFVNK
ncbi:hypothetical protein Xoosp13_80 [Xanthomonas phage Xoo-sp13]|nr:hypothetical protein Xoosp13_80 [Xanthomonas phage Xoo-sp13]